MFKLASIGMLVGVGACMSPSSTNENVADANIARCDQVCQDNRVGFAIDNAGWLLYNENIAGSPSGGVNKTAPCPLGGTAAITGTATFANNGVETTQLTYMLTACGVSASSYTLTLGGTFQMNGTFTSNQQNDITFSSGTLSIAGQLVVLDSPP